MKLKPTLFILAFTSLSLFMSKAYAQSSLKSDKKEIPVLLNDTLAFTIYGMDCPGCASGLEKQVNKIKSIKFSNADWLKQELKIVLHKDSTLNLKQLKKRIKKSNFTLAK